MRRSTGEIVKFNDAGQLHSMTNQGGQVVTVCRTPATPPGVSAVPVVGKWVNMRTGTDCTGTPVYQLVFNDWNNDGLIDQVVSARAGTPVNTVDYQYLGGRLRTVSYPRVASAPATALMQNEAGKDGPGTAGDGALAASAQVSSPGQMAYDHLGNLYFVETAANRLRRVDAAGHLTTAAGSTAGTAGAAGDGGPANAALLSAPTAVTTDSLGNVYVTDSGNGKVRKIDTSPERVITTVVGTGTKGAGRPAEHSVLAGPVGMATDPAGNAYLVEHDEHRIRKIDRATGMITTLVGTGVGGTSPDGTRGVLSMLYKPTAVTVDLVGNVFFADNYSLVRVLILDPADTARFGKIYTVGSAPFGQVWGLAVTGSGSAQKLYVSDPGEGRNEILQVMVATGVTTVVAGNHAGPNAGTGFADNVDATQGLLNFPKGIVVDGSGHLYVADTNNHRIRKVIPGGAMTTVAGSAAYGYRTTALEENVAATSAQLHTPWGLSLDSAGNLAIADYGNLRVRSVNVTASTPTISTVAGNGSWVSPCPVGACDALTSGIEAPRAVASFNNGSSPITLISSVQDRVWSLSGTTINHIAGTGAQPSVTHSGTRSLNAELDTPSGIAVDTQDRLWITDSARHQLSVVDRGFITDLVPGVACPTGTPPCGDAAPSYSGGAQLNAPTGVAADLGGGVYVADSGDHRILKVNLTADFANSYAVVSPHAGSGAPCVVKTGACGDNAASDSARTATFTNPTGLAFDPVGGLYVADTGNHKVRAIAPNGSVRTVIGTGAAGYQPGDDNRETVAATAAELNAPRGVAVEPVASGATAVVHVSDSSNHRIRFAATTAGWRYFHQPAQPSVMTRIEHTVGSGENPMLELSQKPHAVTGRILSQDLPSGQHIEFGYGDRQHNNANPPMFQQQITTISWCTKWGGTSCDTSGGGVAETTLYKHDAKGRLSSMEDTNGRSTSQEIVNDKMTTSTDRSGAKTASAYDSWNRTIQVAKPDPLSGFVPDYSGPCPRDPDGTFPEPSECTGSNQAFTLEKWQYCTNAAPGLLYDPRVRSRTDAANNTTTYLYGASAVKENPCQSSTATVSAYAAQPTATAVIDPNDARTEMTVTDGLLTSTTDADGVKTATTWDTTKRLQLSVKTGPYTTFYGYDAFGRRVVTHKPGPIDPANPSVRKDEEMWTVYDTAGRVTEVVGPVNTTVTTCAPSGTSCALPAGIPSGIDGPTIHTKYRLDGTLLSRTHGENRAQAQGATLGSRTWTYTDRFVNSSGVCSPPAYGCERETTEQEPAHGHDPLNPALTTATVRTVHFNAAGRQAWTQTSDTANTTTAVRSVMKYTGDNGVNLGLGRPGSVTVAAGTPSAVESALGYDGNLAASGNHSTGGNGEVTSVGVGQSNGRIVTGTKVYDKRGRVTDEIGPAVSDNLNASVKSCIHYSYDNLDQVVQTDAGAVTSAGCGDASSTQVLRTRKYYDPAGRTTFTVVHQGSSSTTMTDPRCPLNGGVDRADQVTKTIYTPGGRPVETWEEPVNQTFDPANPTTTGFNWCTGQANVRKTLRTYDAGTAGTGWLDYIVPPAGSGQASTKYFYDPSGRVNETAQFNGTTYTGAKLSYAKTTYDAAGRVQTVSTPSPSGGANDMTTAVSCYNGYGDLTYRSDPHPVNLTTVICDPVTHLGADVAAPSSFGAYQSFDYYDDGSLKNTWSALRRTAGDDARTSYFYDGRGNRTHRTAMTQDSTNATPTTITEKWVYTPADQLKSYTDPQNQATTYEYYANTEVTNGAYPGKLKTVTQPSGRTTQGFYRPDGRLYKQTFTQTGQSTTITTGFGYDARGNQLALSDDATGTTKTTTFAVDRVGRITQQTVPNGYDANTKTYSWGFDTAGNRTRMTYPDTSKYKFEYDNLGRLYYTAIDLFGGWFPIDVTQRDALGRDTVEHQIGGYGSDQTRSWTYNTNGAPQPISFAELIDDTPNNKVINTRMAYYPDGRLKCETQASTGGCQSGATSAHYLYDDAGQLCAVTQAAPTAPDNTCATAPTNATHRYEYNMRGMRMKATDSGGTTYTGYNKNAQPCLQGPTAASVSTCTNAANASASFAYDADGRQTDYHYGLGTTTDPDVATAYDARGLASTITNTPDTGQPVNNVENRRYNAARQLVRVTAGVDAAHQTGNDLVWDDSGTDVPQIIEMRLNGTSYNRLPQGNYRIAITNNASNSAVYAYDAKGSVLNTSKIAAPDSYDPFGKATVAQGVDIKYTSFGYRGELTVNGSVHLRARDYTPSRGTFTSRDPVDGFDGTATVAYPHHYTDNDPLNRIDPTGLTSTDDEEMGSAGVGASDIEVSREQLKDALYSARGLLACGHAAKTAAMGTWFESLTPTPEGNCRAVGYACAGGGAAEWSCQHQDGLLSILQFSASFAAGLLCGGLASGTGPGAAGAAAACGGAVYRFVGAANSGASVLDSLVDAFDLQKIAIDVTIGLATFGLFKLIGVGVKALAAGDTVEGILQRLCGARPTCTAVGAGDDLARACASFSGTTLVVLANGTRTPISEVREGDFVLATDPETGEAGAREVIATLPHTDRLLTLQTSSGDIVTTEDHKYWNASDQAWQESQDLDEGDRLLSADGGSVTVEGLDWSSVHTDDAYDLDVRGLDSFYVGVGLHAVLVHNMECGEWARRFLKTKAGEGGKPVTFKTDDPSHWLGDYDLAKGKTWQQHTVVIKDGKVFDEFTKDLGGMPIEEWKRHWSDWQYIDFGF